VEGSREQRCGQVFGHLVRVVHAVSQDGARALRVHGLTPAQYQVLRHVSARADVQQRELGDLLGVTKGNVSMLVSRLEDDGLLTRTPAGAAYCLRLTEAGSALLARIRPEHAAFLVEQFAGLDDGELAALDRLLAALDRSP
jgi:MarR family transcriptional regulator for hemolysin